MSGLFDNFFGKFGSGNKYNQQTSQVNAGAHYAYRRGSYGDHNPLAKLKKINDDENDRIISENAENARISHENRMLSSSMNEDGSVNGGIENNDLHSKNSYGFARRYSDASVESEGLNDHNEFN